jgi:hypothetical protein
VKLRAKLSGEKKKPVAGGGATGFFKTMNSSWEEECYCPHKRPWEEEWSACKIEALREEDASLR